MLEKAVIFLGPKRNKNIDTAVNSTYYNDVRPPQHQPLDQLHLHPVGLVPPLVVVDLVHHRPVEGMVLVGFPPIIPILGVRLVVPLY